MARFNTFRQSLISKFSISTGIVLVLAITLFALVNLSTLKEAFFQEAMNEVESVSEILLYTTHNHMLEDNRDRVYQMMEEVSKHEKIERIRLFSMQGMVYFSTQPNENGKNLDELAARCRQCHAEGMPQAIPVLRNDRKVFQDCNRKEILSVTT